MHTYHCTTNSVWFEVFSIDNLGLLSKSLCTHSGIRGIFLLNIPSQVEYWVVSTFLHTLSWPFWEESRIRVKPLSSLVDIVILQVASRNLRFLLSWSPHQAPHPPTLSHCSPSWTAKRIFEGRLFCNDPHYCFSQVRKQCILSLRCPIQRTSSPGIALYSLSDWLYNLFLFFAIFV